MFMTSSAPERDTVLPTGLSLREREDDRVRNLGLHLDNVAKIIADIDNS